jgi:hypothetical protein
MGLGWRVGERPFMLPDLESSCASASAGAGQPGSCSAVLGWRARPYRLPSLTVRRPNVSDPSGRTPDSAQACRYASGWSALASRAQAPQAGSRTRQVSCLLNGLFNSRSLLPLRLFSHGHRRMTWTAKIRPPGATAHWCLVMLNAIRIGKKKGRSTRGS